MQAPPRPHGAAWARADPWGGAEDPAAHDPHVASKYVSSIEVRAADEEDQEHRLRCTFDSFAVEGTAELDQIGGILASADVRVSEDDLRDAICQALPAGTLGVSFDDLLLVYDFLTDHRADQAQVTIQDGKAAGRREGLCPRLLALCGAARSVSGKQVKPTTRLLAVNTSFTLMIALAVASFAVGFLSADIISAYRGSLFRTSTLVKDAIVGFAYENNQNNYRHNMAFTADLLGNTVTEVGYHLSIKRTKEDLMFAHRLLVGTLDDEFRVSSLSRVELAARQAGTWILSLWAALGEAAVVALVDNMNRRLQKPGNEIVMGRWRDATNASIAFLTQFRFTSACLGGVCGSDPTAAAPMKAALAGGSGSLLGNDYRPHTVFAGYTYLPFARAGLVYKIDVEQLQQEFVAQLKHIVDDGNQHQEGSTELVLGHRSPEGQIQNISKLRFCDGGCGDIVWEGTVLDLALNGSKGVIDSTDYRGQPVLAAFGPLRMVPVAIALKINLEDIKVDLRTGLAKSLDLLNLRMDRTEEMVLATPNASNASGVDLLTQRKFADQCGNASCGYDLAVAPFIDRAVHHCEEGVQQGYDYRGVAVAAAYRCIPELRSGLVFKVDETQIREDGINLTVNYVNLQNKRSNDTSMEIVLAERRPGVRVADVEGVKDFRFLSQFKHRADCKNGQCGGEGASAEPMVRALQETHGDVTGNDYRPKEVLAVFDFITELGIGLVVKVDADEMTAPATLAAIKLFLICLAFVLVFVLLLAYLTKRMLDSVEMEWVQSKAEVEHEREQFGVLVNAMYPGTVAKLLLAGETQIVFDVLCCAVFFSDIHHFTALSNTMSSDELVQFMGYTFGVMDTIADHMKVHKVKTIGDAYLAVAGLPGQEQDNCCMAMLNFAACCAQIFGSRFCHPNQGDILLAIASRNMLNKKKKTVRLASASEAEGPADGDAAAPGAHSATAQCAMRYGIAAGPLTAGVLQGKTPMFDIWGKTVNLASRMESTGVSGRIQVSELVYRSMVAAPGHTYSFEDAHRVYCKGFGNIPAYFVKCTFDPPPSDLLAQLALSPNYGGFYFDGIGNTAAPANGPNEDAASCLSGPMGAQAASRHNSRPQLVDEPELLTSLTPRADVVSIGEK